MAIEARSDLIDRISPTERPVGRPVMYQEWHHLLFLHWEIDASILRPLIPPRTRNRHLWQPLLYRPDSLYHAQRSAKAFTQFALVV
jgi:hypothetical protein